MTDREIAEVLYEKIKLDKQNGGSTYGLGDLETDAIATVYRLLQNDKDSPIYAYVCRDYLQNTHGDRYLRDDLIKETYLEFKKLKDSGVCIPEMDMEFWEQSYKAVLVREEKLAKIEDDAEDGVWTEEIRNKVEGFELIQGKIGSFHDSELLGFDAHQDDGYVDVKLHMCNGANAIVTLRFMDNVEYDVCADGYVYLYWGFFELDTRGFVKLDLDPYGAIYARKIKVLSVEQVD